MKNKNDLNLQTIEINDSVSIPSTDFILKHRGRNGYEMNALTYNSFQDRPRLHGYFAHQCAYYSEIVDKLSMLQGIKEGIQDEYYSAPPPVELQDALEKLQEAIKLLENFYDS